MYNLYCLKYKNYYNRQVKRLPNLEDYLTSEYLLEMIPNVNFKPDDWLNTSQILNINTYPNYIIVEDIDTGDFTRWFVIEMTRLRNGQHSLKLRRDVICDELKNVLEATTYVEKGYVEEANPLILNSENFECNQIKTDEFRLYDKSGVPWLAIYTSNYNLTEDKVISLGMPFRSDYTGTGSTLQEALNSIDSFLGDVVYKNIIFDGPVGENMIKIDYNEFSTIITKYDKKYFTLTEGSNTNRYKMHFEWYFDLNNKRQFYRMYLSKIDFGSISYNVRYLFSGKSSILLLPYSDFICDTNLIDNLVKNMQLELGSTVIFDAQLLPYYPDFNLGYGLGRNGYSTSYVDPLQDYNTNQYFGTGEVSFTKIASTSESSSLVIHGSRIFVADHLNSSFNITAYCNCSGISYKDLKNLYTYRLCSPNYNGTFEFNVADLMHGHDLHTTLTINVDLNYKPYSPYIHLNPAFSGLYGKDFNDARGLICGGDFSVEQASSEWANYKLQNKNYQNQFDRQIENMGKKVAIDTINSIGSAVTGTVAGGFFGGTGGAIASGVAGAVDVVSSTYMNYEALDYTKDMYNYSLQNIRAVPYSISKVSSINFNNKLVPTLETYTCTEQEKEAFKNKIDFNGMSVKVIGKLKDFVNPDGETYLKGSLIRIDDLNDFNYTNSLSGEVYKGFFISPDDYKDLI